MIAGEDFRSSAPAYSHRRLYGWWRL